MGFESLCDNTADNSAWSRIAVGERALADYGRVSGRSAVDPRHSLFIFLLDAREGGLFFRGETDTVMGVREEIKSAGNGDMRKTM